MTLDGTLEVEAPHFGAAIGDALQIVTSGPGNPIAGRFKKAKIPAAGPGGPNLHLHYEDNAASLVASTIVLGFDLRDPPPDVDMAAFVAAAPYTWVGYYLSARCHSASWMGKRAFLVGLRLGLAVLYVGQQTAGASNCQQNQTTAVRGSTDALQAITRTEAEGFAPGTWIYLDVEKNPNGPPTAGMLAYLQAWVDKILEHGSFNPGIYLHRSEIEPIHAVAMQAFSAHARGDRPRYWCVGGPANVAVTDPPARSGVPEAVAWQQKLDFADTRGGITLTIDRSVSVLTNPSAP